MITEGVEKSRRREKGTTVGNGKGGQVEIEIE